MKNRTAIFKFALVFFLFAPLVINADIIHLAPGDFVPMDPDEGDWRIPSGFQEYIYAESGSSYRFLYSRCLDLPHLGTLDQIRINYLDNSTGHLLIRVVRQKISDYSYYVIASLTTSGEQASIRTEDLESFVYPTIKAKGYRYFIQVYFSSTGEDLALYGIRVRYYYSGS